MRTSRKTDFRSRDIARNNFSGIDISQGLDLESPPLSPYFLLYKLIYFMLSTRNYVNRDSSRLRTYPLYGEAIYENRQRNKSRKKKNNNNNNNTISLCTAAKGVARRDPEVPVTPPPPFVSLF